MQGTSVHFPLIQRVDPGIDVIYGAFRSIRNLDGNRPRTSHHAQDRVPYLSIVSYRFCNRQVEIRIVATFLDRSTAYSAGLGTVPPMSYMNHDIAYNVQNEKDTDLTPELF